GPYQNQPVDWDTVVNKLAEYHFDGVELGAFPPHPNPHDLSSPVARQETVAQMRLKGLAFSGMAPDLWDQKLANTNDHGPYIKAFTRYCDLAQELGIKLIRVDTVQPPEILADFSEAAVLERVTTAWEECAKIAADRGLVMSWEFEPGFVLNTPKDILNVLERIDALNFGVLYDTCHGQTVSVLGARQFGHRSRLAGGQAELIKMLSGRINHIHLIDNDNTLHRDANGHEETSSHVPFGQGVIDFDRIIPLLNEHAPLADDWWTIDLCFWPDPWPATERCKQFVDEQNRKYGSDSASKQEHVPVGMEGTLTE
ncbi:MAG TPA: sugar phosphate isomerase/epimerase family protein, partial [Tepidisphaeraceae bacterium]|nr:sugar phosphate isomerase/epimerase family protein [Tepidisphaeraceae bacterium]